MKVGRNDPCPCGSGKKYKKCCLSADEAKAATMVEPPHAKPAPVASAASDVLPPLLSPLPAPALKRVDPEEDAIDQAIKRRYRQFEASDVNGMVAMFLSLVNGEGDPPMDDEDAFEMLNVLYGVLARDNQRPRFDELLEALRQQQPEACEKIKPYYLEWTIENLAAQGRWDELTEPVKEMAALGGDELDQWLRVLDMLDFHGRLPLLVEAARIAWPKVRESEDVLGWAIDEFRDRVSLYEIYDYVERHPDASGVDEQLLERLRPYSDDEPTWVTEYMAALTRSVPDAEPLKLADFDVKRHKPKRKRRNPEEDEDAPASADAEPGSDRDVMHLSVTFLGWMHREKKVSLTRGEAGRREMVHFLFARAEGMLDDRRSLVERMADPDRRPRKQPIKHPLCPDRERFDAYLAQMLDLLSWQPYKAVSLMSIVPPWLEFLELNGLLTAQQRQETLESLGELLNPLHELLLKHDADSPGMIGALEATWAE